MTTPASLFHHEHVPHLLWPDLIDEFGVDYDYHFAEGDSVKSLRGLLIEGVEDEPVSPGRYARFWADLRDLPQPPRAADWIELEWATYDVEQVGATLFNISRLIVKLSGQSWQGR